MILLQQRVVHRHTLEAARDEKAEEIGDHQRDENLTVLGDLEDHEDGARTANE